MEKALEARVNYIIIEPARLSDETERWITVGNCLHKTAVVSGFASIVSGTLWQDRPAVYASFCAISVFCTGLYTVSWNYDPCCQYQVNYIFILFHHLHPQHNKLKKKINNVFQVERNKKKLLKVPNLSEFSSPVVLVYTANKKTKYLHRTVTLAAAVFCAWKIYETYK